MKNVDVPMWDKGDDTDDFSKGGASGSSMPMRRSTSKKSPAIKKLYKQILGREPSSREVAFHKYSNNSKEDIIKKLISSDEHEELIEKGQKYSELRGKNKKLKSTVLKLKSRAKDKSNEYEELSKLLEEKNDTIERLRATNKLPYLNNEKILDENNVYYSLSQKLEREEAVKVKDKETFWDRLSYLLFGKN